MIAPPKAPQRFISTRGKADPVDLATAVLSGPATDGGLWVPETLAPFSPSELAELEGFGFQDLAIAVGHRLLGTDMERGQLETLIREAFDFEIPLLRIGGPEAADGTSPEADLRVLELFHGPTLAFKDVGARFMARLLGWARQQPARGPGSGTRPNELTILVATSGDTGSAVAHAFLGVKSFRVVVLFPKGLVSEAQQKLFTTLGQNTHSLCVDGTFDDCQRLVKQAFADTQLRERMPLGSANSINVARLLPQSFYYFWLRNQLSDQDKRRPLIVCTPSGNFGNLTAGLLAQRLGLPIDHFIAATNTNDVVPTFLAGGDYRPRPSVQTLANAMDVGDPSNFERILWLFKGDERALRRAISGAHYSDQDITVAIREVNERFSRRLDPHSAIGFLGARDHLRSQSPTAGVRPPLLAFLATAHPAKFAETVARATGSKVPLPPPLALALQGKETFAELEPNYQAFRKLLEEF